MSVLGVTALAAAAAAALAWLVVSFSAPGRRRVVVEWLGTLALYVALLAFFLKLCRDAWQDERTLALVAFGLLAAVFASGGVLSAVRLVQAIRGRISANAGATH